MAAVNNIPLLILTVYEVYVIWSLSRFVNYTCMVVNHTHLFGNNQFGRTKIRALRYCFVSLVIQRDMLKLKIRTPHLSGQFLYVPIFFHGFYHVRMLF